MASLACSLSMRHRFAVLSRREVERRDDKMPVSISTTGWPHGRASARKYTVSQGMYGIVSCLDHASPYLDGSL